MPNMPITGFAGEDAMKFQTLLKSAILGAGMVIFAVGLVLAQTPAPANPPSAASIRDACRNEISADLRGSERRTAMRKCVTEKRQAAGLSPTREARRAQREERRIARRTCREELRNQRFTEDERRDAINQCLAKKDPKFARTLACRKEALEKKLEPRTTEYRRHMRECNRRQ